MASNSIAQSTVERNPRPLETSHQIRADYFKGTKNQLIAAGVAKEGQFPGDPGRGKTMATYDVLGNPVSRGGNRNAETGFQIRRAGRDCFSVEVTLPEDEYQRRLAADTAGPATPEVEAMSLEQLDQGIADLEYVLQKTAYAKGQTDKAFGYAKECAPYFHAKLQSSTTTLTLMRAEQMTTEELQAELREMGVDVPTIGATVIEGDEKLH